MRDCRTDSLETLLVGIDAGCFNVLDPLFDAGELPNLASVMDAGVADELESQIPPWTASAWPSLYTGVNPGKHGVFGFLDFDGYDWNIVNSSHVRERTLWELLDEQGLTSVVVNAPVTYPPPEIDGALIPGYVAPEHPPCHPEGLLDDVEAELGEYRVYTPSLNESASPDRKVREYLDLVQMRGDAFRYLADRFDPEFGFLQFQVTDTVFHEFPGDREKAARVYRAVDEQLGATLENCNPDTVIVASDHGMDSFDERFSLNEYLRREGYVEGVRGGVGMPTWAAVRDSQLVNGEDGDGPEQTPLARLMAGLADVGLTSQRIGSVLETLGLADLAMRLAPDEMIRAGSEQVDFENSVAYMRSRVECGVRLNVAGRDPNGVVSESEYDAVREELIDVLSRATTSEGDPVFEDVVPREEYVWGEYADDAADVFTIPNDFEVYLTTWLTDDLHQIPPGPAWDHIKEGVIMAAGDAVDESASTGNPHLFDVAPTVLASLGVPASDRMDGDPLPFVTSSGVDTYAEATDSTTGTSDEAVEERLADLGYLE
ncbi:alkaline phosphatase family protein [Haloarculaceae archaeon H-GB1-1]|nr:alkaline phosphatase family protein [Haloarculaceae archaeon H-GB1-1]